MKGLKAEPGVSQGFSSLSGQHHPMRVGSESQGAGAEALRVGSQLVLFPVSMYPFLSQHCHIVIFAPERSSAGARGAGVGVWLGPGLVPGWS